MEDDALSRFDSPVVVDTVVSGGFGVEVDTTLGSVVARLRGELDMATAPSVVVALGGALDTRPSSLVVDLSDLAFIDSSGLSVLITLYRRAERQGCTYTLRSPCRAVLKALQLTGVDRLVDIVLAPGTD